MDLFKERLNELGFKVLAWGTVIAVISLCCWLSTFMSVGALKTISMIVSIILACMLALGVVTLVCKFIHWLFIEPFKKSRF